jgi:hypothetical protein
MLMHRILSLIAAAALVVFGAKADDGAVDMPIEIKP